MVYPSTLVFSLPVKVPGIIHYFLKSILSFNTINLVLVELITFLDERMYILNNEQSNSIWSSP